jgi:tetratricopeptide (TPR) repeat protein
MKHKKDVPQWKPRGRVPLSRRDFLMGAGATVSARLLVGSKAANAANSSQEESDSSIVPLQVIVVRTREAAIEMLKFLASGVQFAALAEEFSLEPMAGDDGYMGKVRISELPPEVRVALKGLQPGQWTDVIESSSGFMIVKLLSEAASRDIEEAERNLRLTDAVLARVQTVQEIDGYSPMIDIFTRMPKPVGWNLNVQNICKFERFAETYGYKTAKDNLEAAIRQGAGQPDPAGLMKRYDTLAKWECYFGNMAEGIKYFQAEDEIAVSTTREDAHHKLQQSLGTAYMMKGDLENLAKTVNTESSAFPIRREAKYKNTANEEEAIKYYLKYLQQEPSDLEVKWLINLASMKAGKYPEGVPSEYLIPPEAFKSKEDVGRFVNIAPALGLNVVDWSGGLIVDDFDNDGFLDIVSSSSDPCMPIRYFHNNGDGTFTERTAESGLGNQRGGLNIQQVDYNNDGLLDILVLRGGWSLPMRKSLLRNNGDGTFTDVTVESGLGAVATPTQAGAWADYDNDGNLDLFVGSEFYEAQLFRNKGDGTFVDVAEAAGVRHNRMTKGAAAGDYDNDGYPDIYVSNLDGENFLYHNNGNWTFTEVARDLHVELPYTSFPCWFFDYNNDGWLDIFVPDNYNSDVDVAAGYLNLPLRSEGGRLYRNTGKGTFEDVSVETGVNRTFLAMGSNFGDFDNDGFLDFYLATGAPSYGAQVPNVLFRNHEGKYFTEITASSGTGSLEKGHGVSFADINNDGIVEILVRMGGVTPADRASMLVFKNPGNDNNWIKVRLVGVKTNRSALHARIKVTVATPDHGRRFIHRHVCSGGSFGSSPLEQHIGLGKAKQIEAIEIWWPTSKTRQIFRNIRVNQSIEIKEFANAYTVRQRRSFPLP